MTHAAGVMGSPIAHSLSPALHRAAYRSLGLTNWTYDAMEVDAEGLPGALDRLGPEWVGVSLTMPLKHAVLPLLDEISDLAVAVGAVNTLTLDRRSPPGGQHGRPRHRGRSAWCRRDRRGRCRDRRRGSDRGLGPGRGASARGVRRRWSSSDQRLAAGRCSAAAERLGVAPRLREWSEAGALVAGAPVVISTVPHGAADSLLSPEASVSGVLLDVVYRPWPTPLAAAWVGGRGSRGAGSGDAPAPGRPPGAGLDRPEPRSGRDARGGPGRAGGPARLIATPSQLIPGRSERTRQAGQVTSR